MTVIAKTVLAAAVALGSLGAPDSASKVIPGLDSPPIQQKDVTRSIASGGLIAMNDLFSPSVYTSTLDPLHNAALGGLAVRHHSVSQIGGLAAVSQVHPLFGDGTLRAFGTSQSSQIATGKSSDSLPVVQ